MPPTAVDVKSHSSGYTERMTSAIRRFLLDAGFFEVNEIVKTISETSGFVRGQMS